MQQHGQWIKVRTTDFTLSYGADPRCFTGKGSATKAMNALQLSTTDKVRLGREFRVAQWFLAGLEEIVSALIVGDSVRDL